MPTRQRDGHRVSGQRDNDTDDDKTEVEDEQQSLYVHPILKVAVSGLSGVLFGIALEKGRVFEPQVIRDQMLLRRFVMLKMFLAASATGMVSFTLLRLLPRTIKALQLATKTFGDSLRMNSVLGVSVGAAILGAGMTVSGSCPGNVLVQIGAGVPNAVFTIAGGLFGGLLYAATCPIISPFFEAKKQSKVMFLDRYLKIDYISLAIPLAVVLSGAIMVFEYLFPWDTEVSVEETPVGLIRAYAWPPFIAGIFVGSLQIPLILANQDTLGSSSSYVTLGSQILIIKPLQNSLNYMKSYRFGFRNWWQVIYIGGAILGGYISAQASSSWGTVAGITPWHGFVGGLLMIYGARMADGCTSGHGLSGMGLLALLSFVAVPSMFKGGIVTAYLMQYLGVSEFQ